MTDRRLPRPGEVWHSAARSREERHVLNVYPDAVSYLYLNNPDVYACSMDHWLKTSVPPGPALLGTVDVWFDCDSRSFTFQQSDRTQRVGTLFAYSDATFVFTKSGPS